METVLNAPYITRLYPSPRTGQEMEVRVKEILLSDYPNEYVGRRFDAATDLGNHLILADTRGGRPWRVQEHSAAMEEFGTIPGEHPWIEVWEIGTTDQIAVLDVIMYTGFYSDTTMGRFDEFTGLVKPLIQSHGARIRSACGGGVSLETKPVRDESWQALVGRVLDFNQKHFGFKRPRSTILKEFLMSKTKLWFGYC